MSAAVTTRNTDAEERSGIYRKLTGVCPSLRVNGEPVDYERLIQIGINIRAHNSNGGWDFRGKYTPTCMKNNGWYPNGGYVHTICTTSLAKECGWNEDDGNTFNEQATFEDLEKARRDNLAHSITLLLGKLHLSRQAASLKMGKRREYITDAMAQRYPKSLKRILEWCEQQQSQR